MRSTLGSFKAFALLCTLLALLAQSSSASIELKGNLPGGMKSLVLIKPHGQTGLTGVVKFKFSAPGSGAYALSFCIGPESNPCGLATSYVVTVPAGQERLAVVDARMFANNVLVVGQGTTSVVPYAVTIE